MEEYLSKVESDRERKAPGGSAAGAGAAPGENERQFEYVCRLVKEAFDSEWDDTDDDVKRKRLEREKRAIIGEEEETSFYKEKIRAVLLENKVADAWYPSWFPNLPEAVFAELYGLSGLAGWAYDMDKSLENSSSAKLIGDRLYYFIDGKCRLQPQRIDRKRRDQLKRALLLSTPAERLEYGFHEIYLHNGIRITIYSGHRTKEDQEIMVFRKYVLENYTFEELAEKETIPEEAIPLFLAMIEAGFNVLISGQVRSGKTTFLRVWQSHENPELEGLAIATDPETPWHEIMPDAPIMQLIADGDELKEMSKALLRGDNDYVILEEMRDAAAFSLALDITSTGTMRSKVTVHDNSGINVPYKMASKIVDAYGGSLREHIAQAYKNFDYIFEFCQNPENRAKKILKGILELAYDPVPDEIRATYMCRFDFERGTWKWNCHMDKTKREKTAEISGSAETMMKILSELSSGETISEWTVKPSYYSRGGEAR